MAAREARRLDAVVLSTEDEEIAAVGVRLGLEVPFLRPAGLARDETPTLPVVQHAVAELEREGRRFDAVCLLQPTSPLREAATIDACIEELESSDADSIFTILEIPQEHHPFWSYLRTADGGVRLTCGATAPTARRQELPPAYHREGSVYVTRREALMDKNSLYGERTLGRLVDAATSVNIDLPEDLVRAERLLATRMERTFMIAAEVS